MAVVQSCLVALGCLIGHVHAASFLQANVEKQDIEQTIQKLSEREDSPLRIEVEEEILPMFRALPKTEHGTLEPSTVRHAVHRYFVYKHGWNIQGLQSTGWNASEQASVMKHRAPEYIQGLFETQLHGEGMQLRQLAVFIAALTELVHKEALGQMLRLYAFHGYDATGVISEKTRQSLVRSYFIMFLLGEWWDPVDLHELKMLETRMPEYYPAWADTAMWAMDSLHTFDRTRALQQPFSSKSNTFESMVDFAQMAGHNFGAFQNLECVTLKDRLVSLEHQGSGRVRLSRFYEGGVTDGDGALSESVDYLRNLGALDESDPQMPSVIITNYLISPTNCLTASGFYHVCCSDECEGLRREVETAVAASSATPDFIAGIVSNLHSDTVEAPRELSSALLGRLNEIADFHAGQVPLQGRLFAQWMHHAYPRECPFPHEAGTVSAMSPAEWITHHGLNDTTEHAHVMTRYHQAPVQDDVQVILPWTATEELFAEDKKLQRSRRISDGLRMLVGVAILASFLAPLSRGLKTLSKRSDAKPESLMV